MGKNKAIKKIFHSRFFISSVIFSLVLLLSSEAIPNRVEFDSDKEFKPVVKVREERGEVPAAQKEQFEKLIEEGKRLFQEEMDYEGAIRKFEEAKLYSVTRIQKADISFYLSLVYYATQEEMGLAEFDKAIRKLIGLDYYRELDKRLCPPKYIELFQGVKKEYGALKVQSNPPGADVYLNDSKEPVGKTPLTIGSKAGPVKVKVKKGRKEKKELLEVIAGTEIATSVFVLKGISALTVILGGVVLAGIAGAAAVLLGKKGTGSIQVSSTPTGAKVFLDGSNTGQTTYCTLADIFPGSHTVRLDKEGYEDYEKSVSVTAGKTAIVSAALTKPTITVMNYPLDFVWAKGTEIEIQWQTSGSTGVSTGARLDPLIYHGRNLLDPFQRRAFQERPSQESDIRERGELENSRSSEKFVILSSKQSKLQGISKKQSSYARAGDIFNRRAKDIRDIKRNSRVGIKNIPVVPQISNGNIMPSGDIRVLALSYVKIDLYKGGTFNQTIVESTENDGSYTWTVDPSLEDGIDYQIRISNPSDSTVYDWSHSFVIGEVLITVIEPTSTTGWARSFPADITWTSNGAINDVKIDLYKGGTFNQTIVSSTANDGSYTWTEVDTSLADGSDYKVRICWTYSYSIYGESEEFRITHGNELVTQWGSKGSEDGQFAYPTGIAVDSSGYVYVVDNANFRIQKFTSDGTFVTKWGSAGNGNGEFSSISGIAVDSSGYVYVADHGNHLIQKFTSDGQFIQSWSIPSRVIAADNSFYVYVSYDNYYIRKMGPSGNLFTEWGGKGTEDGQFNRISGIAVDSSGYVYVADWSNECIQKFTSDGIFILKWGGFSGLSGIAVDNSGYVYATEYFNHRVQKFTPEGGFITEWGILVGEEDWAVVGIEDVIAVDSSGYVYVTNLFNHCVQKFGPASPSTQQLTRNNPAIFNNNFSINNSSLQKFNNTKSSIQSRSKQSKQIKRKNKNNEKRK